MIVFMVSASGCLLYTSTASFSVRPRIKANGAICIMFSSMYSFMRGRTLNDAVVILDEAQNKMCIRDRRMSAVPARISNIFGLHSVDSGNKPASASL